MTLAEYSKKKNLLTLSALLTLIFSIAALIAAPFTDRPEIQVLVVVGLVLLITFLVICYRVAELEKRMSEESAEELTSRMADGPTTISVNIRPSDKVDEQLVAEKTAKYLNNRDTY